MLAGASIAAACSWRSPAEAAGDAVTRSWHLPAEGDDGPLIPSMAVEAVVRKLLAGHAPPAGSRPAIGELQPADYERLFARRNIHTGTRDDSAAGPVYARVLGNVWNELPAEIRRHARLARRSRDERHCSEST